MHRIVKDATGAAWRLSHVGTQGPSVRLNETETRGARTMDVYEARRVDAPDMPARTLLIPRSWDLDDPYVQQHLLTIELAPGFE
jgi:hypothetical protein